MLPSGDLVMSAGKYARSAVLAVFENLGGVEAMTVWADKNPTDFYTKLFPKTITKEIEGSRGASVEDMLDELDGEYEEVDVEEESGA